MIVMEVAVIFVQRFRIQIGEFLQPHIREHDGIAILYRVDLPNQRQEEPTQRVREQLQE